MERWPEENPEQEGFLRRWRNARKIGRVAKVMQALAEVSPSQQAPKPVGRVSFRMAGNH